MNASARHRLQELGEEGPRRFSHWDSPLFAAYCRSVLPGVWERLARAREGTFAGFAAMVQRGSATAT